MSQIYHRSASQNPPLAVQGEGVYLFDHQGNRYLDACCGAAVSCLGHNNEYVIDAIKQQLSSVPYAHTSFFSTEAAEQLADLLTARSGMDKVYFLSGGSEANETALKMARQYFVEKGEPQRQYFISRRQSYHGSTLATLSVGGNLFRRAMYEPIIQQPHHIAPCFAYREKNEHETEYEYGQRTANELEQKILELGVDNVIGFIVEPVVGSTTGATPAVEGYFKRIREICDQYGVLLILDEIMCGMGRTGSYFAYQQEQIQPDIVTVGKGIGAGYQPLAATLVKQFIFEAIQSGSGAFQHGHTYIGHACAAAAGLATQTFIEEHNLLDHVQQQSQKLFQALNSAFAEHPHIGDIRGRGLFIGIELVSKREDKTPFAVETKLDKVIKQVAMQQGLMLYPLNGTIDGKNGHHILLAPPFIFQDNHIDELVTKLSVTLQHALPA